MFNTLAIFCGGLGTNQFRLDPSPAFGLPPTVYSIFLDDVGYSFGKIPDITDTIKRVKNDLPFISRVVVVSHSMGWIAGAKASIEGLVNVLIACDPVGLFGIATDRWPHPNESRQPGVFAKALPTAFITQLEVIDGPPIVLYAETHNNIIHSKEFIYMAQGEIIG